MKITTLKKYKTKLLKLKLLKTKIYKNEKNLDYLLLKDLEIRLKKILKRFYNNQTGTNKVRDITIL